MLPDSLQLNPPPPIVVFDSGVGGLAVLEALIESRPDLRYVYVADTAWMPYGSKDTGVISHRLELLQRQVETLTRAQQWVLACNTASACLPQLYRETASGEAPQSWDKRWLGILRPTVEEAARWSSLQTGPNPVKVALMATESTVRSQRYNALFQAHADNIHFQAFACPGLAEAVEGRPGYSVEQSLSQLMPGLLSHDPDLLILACTHYLHIEEAIRGYLPPKLTVMNPATVIAEALQPSLPTATSIRPKKLPSQWLRVLTTANPESFQEQSGALPLKNLPPLKAELLSL
jgi:glutamate racemase